MIYINLLIKKLPKFIKENKAYPIINILVLNFKDLLTVYISVGICKRLNNFPFF